MTSKHGEYTTKAMVREMAKRSKSACDYGGDTSIFMAVFQMKHRYEDTLQIPNIRSPYGTLSF
jgi:hypothetical protein